MKIIISQLLKNKSVLLFIGYLFFAGIAALVDLGLLYALTEFFGIYYLLSAGISYCAGMLTNFSLNKFYNFRNKSKKIMHQFAVFLFVALIGLVLNQILLYLFVEYRALWYMLAKIITVAIVAIWSFIGHKKLTFALFK